MLALSAAALNAWKLITYSLSPYILNYVSIPRMVRRSAIPAMSRRKRLAARFVGLLPFPLRPNRDPNPLAAFGCEKAYGLDTIALSISEKKLIRQKLFKNIGKAISSLKRGDPDVPDYLTGKASRFHIANGDQQNRDLHEIPFGPDFKTPQWQRTAK